MACGHEATQHDGGLKEVPMHDLDRWVVVDTETTGIGNPIYPVEIAAQLMSGWTPAGEPFRVLVNFDVPIEPIAEKMHGYSRDYLREHGMSPTEALSRFLEYAGSAPVVAYNMPYDLGRVLIPTLQRAGYTTSVLPGFCALNLTRRVVTGLPDFKLKTVIKSFALAKEQVHHAGDDVRLVVRFLSDHLGPHLQNCEVCGFERVAACSEGTIPVAPLEAPAPARKARKKQTLDQSATFAIGELVGVCRMITLDNRFTADELNFLAEWLERCPHAGVQPISSVFDTVREIIADGEVTSEEQARLRQAIEELLAWTP